MTTITTATPWERSTEKGEEDRAFLKGPWKLIHDKTRGDPAAGGEWIIIRGALVQLYLNGDIAEPPFGRADKLAKQNGDW